MNAAGRWLLSGSTALLLGACAGPRSRPHPSHPDNGRDEAIPAHETSLPQSRRYRQDRDDGPRASPIDVSKIPEPVPKVEPHSRYGNKSTYSVLGRTYHVLPTAVGYDERGIASWYGNKFHGFMTSSFEPYDMYAFTAAHKTLPLPSYARVTNLANGKSVVVRVNDRGPFVENRLIDLSYAAAVKIGIWPRGTGMVEVRAIDPAHPQAEPATSTAVTGKGSRHALAHIYLQLGAFGDRRNAERLARALERAGIDGVRVQTAAVNGRRLHRVRVGPLANVAAADALSPRIRKLGFGVPRVTVQMPDDR
ncbi:MAG: septal ring lytic transglycosylase RlpA family protein [Rhodanobacteraceae bacterium]